jgi:hypothetical protein
MGVLLNPLAPGDAFMETHAAIAVDNDFQGD